MSLAIFLVSAWAVYKPLRPAAHYLVLLIPALALVEVATLASCVLIFSKPETDSPARRPVLPALLFILLAVLTPLFLKYQQPGTDSQAWMASMPRVPQLPPAMEAVSRYAKPGDEITVWGWGPNIYVQTGTAQATRGAVTYGEIPPNPLQPYFRGRFMEDLRRHPPKVFVDDVGPGQPAFQDRAAFGHEIFPELRTFVDTYYQFAGDYGGARLYTRR